MNMTQHKSGLRWLWLAVLAFVLDQASKLAVVKLLPFGYPGVEITPFFNLVHVYNKGAAFSFLADQGGWQRWFFAVLAFAICGLLIHWLRKQSVTQRWSGIAYSLIIGGALGNVFDRLVLGHVAVRAALGRTEPLGRLRAELHQLAGCPAIVTYDPAFLLRSQGYKGAAWADLCRALALVHATTVHP